jgi:hypothetical protein
LFSSPVTASASGTLTSVGVYLTSHAGNVRVAIYSSIDSSHRLTGLLGQSSSVEAVEGWNDLSISGVTIASGTTYWIAFLLDNSAVHVYYGGSAGSSYQTSMTYGRFVGPSVAQSLFASNFIWYMRMTYNSAYNVTPTPTPTPTPTSTTTPTPTSTPTPTKTISGTIDTIGSTANNFGTVNNNYIFGSPVTASASGTLTSVGVYLATVAGNVRVAIYGTLNGSPAFATLLGQSASVKAVNGWNDLAISGVTIAPGTTYYIAFQVDNSATTIYYGGSVGAAYDAYMSPYGSFVNPSATLTKLGTNVDWYMRMTYSTAPTPTPTPIPTPTRTPTPTPSPSPTPTTPPSTNNLAPLPSGWGTPGWMPSSDFIYPVTRSGQTRAKILDSGLSSGTCDREIDSNWIAVSPGKVVYLSAWLWTESSTIGDNGDSWWGAAMGLDAYSNSGRICEVDPQNGIGTPDRVNGVYATWKDMVPWGSGAWVHLTMTWTVPSTLSSDGFGDYPLDAQVAPTGFIAWITGFSSNPGHEGAAIYVYGTVLNTN